MEEPGPLDAWGLTAFHGERTFGSGSLTVLGLTLASAVSPAAISMTSQGAHSSAERKDNAHGDIFSS